MIEELNQKQIDVMEEFLDHNGMKLMLRLIQKNIEIKISDLLNKNNNAIDDAWIKGYITGLEWGFNIYPETLKEIIKERRNSNAP